MLDRCNNPSNEYYKNYGGRGISVCKEWTDDRKSFFEWALNNGYTEVLTLERINNDKEYSPSNCTWKTRSEQMMNTRRIKSNNTSGHRGVSKCKQTGKFASYVNVNNKRVFHKRFDTLIEAAVARDSYIINNGLGHTLTIPHSERIKYASASVA